MITTKKLELPRAVDQQDRKITENKKNSSYTTQPLTAEDNEPNDPCSESLLSSSGFYNLREVANELQIKGMGRNNLAAFLRLQNVLKRDNTPYPVYFELGYCDVFYKYTYYRDGGIREVVTIPLFTYKGVEFIKSILTTNLV